MLPWPAAPLDPEAVLETLASRIDRLTDTAAKLTQLGRSDEAAETWSTIAKLRELLGLLQVGIGTPSGRRTPAH